MHINLKENLSNSITTALIDKAVVSDDQYRPKLLVNNSKTGLKILTSLQDELRCCEEFAISVAFINSSGIIGLKDIFKELVDKGVRGRILTTNYLNFTEPKALKELKQFRNIEIKMYKAGERNEGFHTKGYIFKKNEIYDIIVGSSNLTQAAISINKEWNIKLVARKEGEYATKVVEEFEELWNSNLAQNYEEFIEQYTLEYEIARKQRAIARESQVISFEKSKLSPNKMQLNFISNLQKLIENGQNKALLISATGTGKTYAAAFAMRELGIKKMLFIVHREQIAVQARKSFENVFGTKVKTGLLTGSTKDFDSDLIFATKDTFTREDVYQKFADDYFDAIIIDEVHRLGEQTTYQRILEYFKPNKLWLGMTASPERMDGYDIYKEFDHNIACEIRLQQALEDDLLCPFHYFGITEFIGKDNEEYDLTDFRLLVSKERIDYIIEKIKFYGFSGDRVKGLIFCSRVDEAEKLSEVFNKRGYSTAVLTGNNNEESVRSELIDRLVSDKREDKLDYIITVNVFNEGVDIPEINQVVMLRPTESPIIFVQQLGRGLRKSKDKEYVVVLDFIGNYNNNFMIPIALSGDRSYNKDNVRKFIQQDSKMIPGCSTINFDEISKRKIYKAIDIANFSDLRLIKQNYINLKNKLGKIPTLIDFDKYGEIDPIRIFDCKGSYYRFLVDVERDNYNIRINEKQEKYIKYISTKLANGKRIQELELIKVIIEKKKCKISDFKTNIKREYNLSLTNDEIHSIKAVLTNEFLTGTAKTQYEDCAFIKCLDDSFIVDDKLNKMLDDNNFRMLVEELLEFGIYRYTKDYNNRYKDTNFVLYKKYSYEDICRLLNWEKSVVSLNIGGYKYDEKTNTYPAFINYDKSEDISDTIKYNDRFLSESELLAISKNGRTLQSNDVKQFIDSDKNLTRVYLFVRKNKDDVGAKEFYFLGQMHYSGFSKEITMTNANANAVEIGWKLETPVESSIYEYIIS